jgi:hypothetical protein
MNNRWVDKIDCEHIALWLEIPVCTKIRLNVSKDYCSFCIRNGYNKRPLKLKENDDA